MSRRTQSPPRSKQRFPSSSSSEQRQNQERLKALTDELAKLKSENSKLQTELAHERSHSPARARPTTPLPADDDLSILNYTPSTEEKNPVDRLMTEVQQKSVLVRKVEEAKKKNAAPSYIKKLESLMKRLDTLHASLAQRVDGRLIAHIRANSPPRTREGTPRLGSPREATTSLETAQQMREMLQRRHDRMAAVQGGLRLSETPGSDSSETVGSSAYESTTAAASRMADRMASRPSLSTAHHLIGALGTPSSDLNSRVDAALAAGQASTTAARNMRTSPPLSPKSDARDFLKDPLGASGSAEETQGDYLLQRKYERKQDSTSQSPPRQLKGYSREEVADNSLTKKLEAQRVKHENELASFGKPDRNRRKSISEMMGSGQQLSNNLAAQREQHEREMAAILK